MSGPVGYAPPRFAAAIATDLSKNEGRPPQQAELLQGSIDAAELARYPDLRELQEAMAAAFGADPDSLLVTAGADDALLRVCLLCLRRTGADRPRAIIASPTFEMIPRYIELAGGEVQSVAWPQGALPVESMLAAAGDSAALVFVVSPNNPTGAVATARDLRRLATELPEALIVWDGAYAEFADEDLMATARDLANVVIVRTLSKAWGLAGLRVGCAIATPDLIQQLHAAGNPMPVSIASAKLAIARLTTGRDEVADYVAWVRERRQELVRCLQRLGVRTAEPTQANFVLATGIDPQWFRNALAASGIAVRQFPSQPQLEDAIRIAIPADERQFAALVSALETILAPEALLFDMDGVLADVTQSYRAAIIATAKSYGVTVDAGDIRAAKQRGNANDDWRLTQSLLADRGCEQPLADVTERFEAAYQGLRDRERLLIGGDRLRSWRRRFRMAVVTGRPRAQAEFFLAQFGIRDLFDSVVCREDAAMKPSPAPVQLALRQLGAQTAWMLGDTLDDMLAAKRAGVLPIGVGSEVAAADAARVLKTTEDLEELL